MGAIGIAYRLRRRLGIQRADLIYLTAYEAIVDGRRQCFEQSFLLVFGENKKDGTSFRTFGKENVERLADQLARVNGPLRFHGATEIHTETRPVSRSSFPPGR